MVIISDYILKSESDSVMKVESRCVSFCPKCGKNLSYRDSRKRIMKQEGGKKSFLIIRRLCCPFCHTLHNELPDCITPRKQYSTETISGVLDEIVHPDDVDSEMYPCETTMIRWHHWLMANQIYIEEYIGHKKNDKLDSPFDFEAVPFSLDRYRKVCKNWLESILYFVYNTGGVLVSLHSFS